MFLCQSEAGRDGCAFRPVRDSLYETESLVRIPKRCPRDRFSLKDHYLVRHTSINVQSVRTTGLVSVGDRKSHCG